MEKELPKRLAELCKHYEKERARIRRHLACFYVLHVVLSLFALASSLLVLYYADNPTAKLWALAVALAVGIMAFAKPKEYWQAFVYAQRGVRRALDHVLALYAQDTPEGEIAATLYDEAETALDDEVRLKMGFDRSSLGSREQTRRCCGGDLEREDTDGAASN